MKNNFLFRNFESIKKYLRVALVMQITSFILFSVSAFSLFKLGLQQEYIILFSSIIVIACISLYLYSFYKDQFLFLSIGIWPLDGGRDFIGTLRKFFKKTEKQYSDIKNMQYETEILLTENIQLRKSALAIRAPAKHIKEISDSYKKILDLRSRIKESKLTAEEMLKDFSQAIELAESGRDEKEVLDMIDSFIRVRDEQKNLNKLKRQEREVSIFQSSVSRTLLR